MELSHDEVRRIAELARLHLTEEEIALYAGQLAHVLDAFQNLRGINTEHIAPTASVLPLVNVMRADEPGAPLTPEQVIANAAHSSEGQFLVEDIFNE